MKDVYIMEELTNAIEKKILGEWKHEGFIGGFTSESIIFVVDNKEYELKLTVLEDEEETEVSPIEDDSPEKPDQIVAEAFNEFGKACKKAIKGDCRV